MVCRSPLLHTVPPPHAPRCKPALSHTLASCLEVGVRPSTARAATAAAECILRERFVQRAAAGSALLRIVKAQQRWCAQRDLLTSTLALRTDAAPHSASAADADAGDEAYWGADAHNERNDNGERSRLNHGDPKRVLQETRPYSFAIVVTCVFELRCTAVQSGVVGAREARGAADARRYGVQHRRDPRLNAIRAVAAAPLVARKAPYFSICSIGVRQIGKSAVLLVVLHVRSFQLEVDVRDPSRRLRRRRRRQRGVRRRYRAQAEFGTSPSASRRRVTCLTPRAPIVRAQAPTAGLARGKRCCTRRRSAELRASLSCRTRCDVDEGECDHHVAVPHSSIGSSE